MVQTNPDAHTHGCKNVHKRPTYACFPNGSSKNGTSTR